MSVFIPRSTLRPEYRCNTTQVMFFLIWSHLHVRHGHSHMVIRPADRFVKREGGQKPQKEIRTQRSRRAADSWLVCCQNKKKKLKKKSVLDWFWRSQQWQHLHDSHECTMFFSNLLTWRQVHLHGKWSVLALCDCFGSCLRSSVPQSL